MKAAALVLAACAACAIGGKRPDYQYYVLASQTSAAPARSTPGTPTFTVTVTMPGYLDREQIATRTGPHVTYSTTDRWAEPLDQAFERTLREDLATQLRQRGIQVAPQGGNAKYEIAVDVMRFERTAADRVELWARWSLRLDGEIVDGGATRMQVETRGPDTAAATTALGEAVRGMASEIADGVQQADTVAARPAKRRGRAE